MDLLGINRNHISVMVLDNLTPVFDENPTIDKNGVLLIKGHYPTQPNQVLFEQKYIFEGSSWKLVGLKVQIK